MNTPTVAIVRNQTNPDAERIHEMVKEVLELSGGLSDLVHKGDHVVIKGNFFAPYPPPVSIDRRVVKALIQELYAAGAGKVTLCEAVSVGTKLGRNSSTKFVMDEMCVTQEAEDAGAEVLCLEDDERVRVKVPGAKSIGEINYPKTVYDCDVLIDLPCLKMHGMTLVTLGIKNFQGLLDDQQKYYAHRDDLEEKLVDVMKVRKPDLTLIDGLIAMEGNGAGESGIPRIMNILLASRDVVAADAVGSACMGIEDVMDVTTTRIADYEGIGCGKLDQIKVVGAQIDDIKQKFKYPDKFSIPLDKRLLAAYPNVDVRIGGACRQCWGLAGNIAKKLSKYSDHKFYLIIGADPKIGIPEDIDLSHTIVFGDCACSATGDIKELRNKMLLENKGCLAMGCPPYRPASAIIDKFLDGLGLLDKEASKASAQKTTKRCYDYYKSVDPTWVPLSEQIEEDK